MKRSEMIKKMVHDTFYNLSNERTDNAEFPYKVAELMLDVCEDNGMLPPQIPTEGVIIIFNNWEPENNDNYCGAV